MHFVPTKKEVYVICTQKSRNVLRSQDNFMQKEALCISHPQKKEVYAICTQKSRTGLRSQDYLRTYMYFVPNFKNVETLSLPLNYNITI